ncbi:MAG: ArsR family transcriptional regulator [Methanolinea sp.]|jgi:hypothetical protein|nr:ArsR family transcriptional regulator [Methanolinea sp.]
MTSPLPYPDTTGPFIQILSSDQGLKAIDSPLKGKILEMLQERDMDFEEIVSRSGRAKSTISAHLKALAEAGITASRPDPVDARRRIFSLNGRIVVRADAGDAEMLWADRFFPDALPDDATTHDVFRFILTSLRVSLLTEGIRIHPILERAGRKAGAAIYLKVRDSDIVTFLNNIVDFWARFGLGEMDIERHDPLTVVIHDCFECMDLPITGRPECAFDAGVLSALFSAHYGEKKEAVETHCYAMGSNLCRFEIWNAR